MKFSRRINSPWIAGPLSGILLVLAFPLIGLFPLAWVALVPLLAYIVRRPSWSRLFIAHYLFGLVFFTLHLSWIPSVLTSFGGFPILGALPALVALTLLMTTLSLPFSLLMRRAATDSPELALLCAPGFWILCELIRTYAPAQGFPWGLLGSSQVPSLYLVQIADLSGVFGVSYLIVVLNAAVTAWFLRLEGRARLAGIAGALLATTLVYGVYRVHFWSPQQTETVRVGLIQPDVGLTENREHYARKYFQEISGLYKKAVEQGAVWTVVSEAQNPYLFGRDYYYTTYWRRKTSSLGVPLLFNGAVRTRAGEAFNSALLLNGQGRIVFRYDKIRLVPFGEYVPWRRMLGLFFSPLVREVASFSPGRVATVGRMEGTSFGVLICFESIFPQAARQVARQGAEVVVNMSNDSWYGDSAAPAQLLQMTRLRAIEARKPILRAANSGITAQIDPWGRINASLPRSKVDVLVVDVAGVKGTTLYSMMGEWPNILLVAGCLATLASLVRISSLTLRLTKRTESGVDAKSVVPSDPVRRRKKRGLKKSRLFRS